MRKFILFVFFKQVQSTNSWCPNLYGQSEKILTKIWKTKWPPNQKIEHNSLISWQNFEKQNGRQITKLSITHSFLELQSPDFAWKFVWTKFWKTKWPPKNKMAPNHKIKLILTGASAILASLRNFCIIIWKPPLLQSSSYHHCCITLNSSFNLTSTKY